MTFDIKPILTQLTQRRDLTREQSRITFDAVMSGLISETELAAILGAIATKGESVDELVGAAEAMRARSIRIKAHPDCIDTCGTGGDGISTFNTSTAAAIIAAAAGAIVAKHGNRSATRVSGSTEVLDHLGINVDAPTEIVERCLREIHIGYLNARNLHPAMKYAAPVRQALPIRTIFNLLGPLTNPAGAKRQLLGVPRVDLVDIMANALHRLGAVHAWVVHGSDGLCDLTITGEATVAEVTQVGIRRFTITPDEVELSRETLDSLLVESPQESARKIEDILNGVSGAPRNHAVFNAGAAILVAGVTDNLKDGIARATQAIENGSAANTLKQWRMLAPKSQG